MTRARLRKQVNMSGLDEDYTKKYKRHRNLVVSMNRKAKRDFSILWTLTELIMTKSFGKWSSRYSPIVTQWGKSSPLLKTVSQFNRIHDI